MENNQKASSGISFCGLLTIVFIVLKLIEKIDWDWIWVLSPLWIPIAIYIGIFVFSILVVYFKNHNNEF